MSDEKADELIIQLERLNENLENIERTLKHGKMTVETI